MSERQEGPEVQRTFTDALGQTLTIEPDPRDAIITTLLAEKQALEAERDEARRIAEVRGSTLNHMGAAVMAMEEAQTRAEKAEAERDRLAQENERLEKKVRRLLTGRAAARESERAAWLAALGATEGGE